MNSLYKIIFFLLAGPAFILAFVPQRVVHSSALAPADTIQRLTMLFAGDVMQHQTQIDAAYNSVTGAYEYDSCFNYVRSIISSYDIAIANLEVTLGGKPYRGYPQFSAPDNIAVALKNAGFDYVATANNHSCDRGSKGIERTIHILDSLDLPHTGTFTDTSERTLNYPLIINKNGIKIALLNYTYGTNGLNVPAPRIVNMIDTGLIAIDLRRAKDSLPDKTIIFLHWGDEYQSQPNEWQKLTAKYCLDHGADIVIGSHPHVLQKMERYTYPDSNGREVVVVYSLGNYISNQRDRGRDGGAMIGFELTKQSGHTQIGFAGYYLSWVWITRIGERKQYYIVPVSGNESMLDLTDPVSAAKMKIFIEDARDLYSSENCDVGEFLYDVRTDVWRLH